MSHAPSIDFCALITGFARAALIDLGQLPEPGTGALARDLAMAAQNIAILEILQEKTRGNLNPAEQLLLDKLLGELNVAIASATKEEACGK